jgi:hypothetical protein
MPPSRSGIAAYSAEVLPLLAERGVEVDGFVDGNAPDFVWKHRRHPYDLTVFHLGNAACHDYIWAYLFRYPGLLVLHDAQLHQARALALTKRWIPRRDDYLAEFRANHPDAPPSVGEVVAAGFGGSLYVHWPQIRLVIESARMTVVHNGRLLADLREKYPSASLDAIRMGVRDPLALPRSIDAVAAIRAQAGIPAEAIVLAAFGGITPEKRIEPLLSTLSALAGRHPHLHVMLVGSAVDHYDVMADAARWAVADRVHVTGYVPDGDLPDYLLAADLCACLRWPTNRETSASWLRCLAAGRATLVSDLSDLVDVPTLDPRGWALLDTSPTPRPPVAVSIDVVDEAHSLRLSLDRLLTDEPLRHELGVSARSWWASHHQLEMMADDYVGVMARAMSMPVPRIDLPAHLQDDGSRQGRELAAALGVGERLADVFPR